MRVRMDNAAAVAYATHGAGRSSQLTRSERGIRGREIVSEYTAAAFHIAGRENAVADALSCCPTKVSGGDPFSDRELRRRFCVMAAGRFAPTDVDMISDDKGLNAWRGRSRSPAHPALE